MLKKDWERSKSEVRGYSNIVVYTGITILISLIYMIYYLYILKLGSIPFLLFMLFINVIPLFFTKFFLVDEIDAIENERKRMPIKLLIKKEKKIRKITIQGILCIIFIFIVNMLIGMYYYPKVMSEAMSYCKENETIYLFTNLDLNLIGNLEGNLQRNVKDKVIIVKSKSELPVEQERQDVNDAILERAIQNSIDFWNVIITILAVCIPIIGLFISTHSNMETRKYVAEIDRIDYMVNCKYKTNLQCDSKQNDVYLGLIYSLLADIEKNLRIVIWENEKSVESVSEYDKLSKKKEKLEEVRVAMKQIMKINRKVRLKTKKELLPSVKEKINKIDFEKFELEC